MVKIFALTHHLRERFVQRTNKRFQHLQECRQPHCPKCETLLTEIRQIISREQTSLDQKILDSLRQAQECRCYINNTEFMTGYYERYGFDKRFEFLIDKGLLFVVVVEDGKRVVVTCVRAKTHIAGKPSLRPKFRSKSNLLDTFSTMPHNPIG